MTKSTTRETADVASIAGRKNLIINGGFDVWQRGDNTTNSNANGYGAYLAADRWGAYYTGTKLEKKEYTIDNQLKHAMRITSTTGNSAYAYQSIESGSALSNQTLTYSYWARANRAGTISGNNTFRYVGVDGANMASNVAGLLNSHHVDTGWRKITKTITLINDSYGTSFDRHLFFLIALNDTLIDDWLEVAEVQLELGSAATDFEHRSYGEELALCQRFYQIVGASNRFKAAGSSEIYTNTVNYFTEMRTTPTATKSGGIVSNIGSENLYSLTSRAFRYELSNTSAGDAYYLGRIVSLDAEL